MGQAKPQEGKAFEMPEQMNRRAISPLGPLQASAPC